MKRSVREAVATLLFVAMMTCYAGFLVGWSMPFIHDTLATAASAFILWVAVFLLTDGHDITTPGRATELLLFAASITLGGAAVLAADMRTGPAPVLLAAFVVTAVVTWTVRLLYDSGRPRHGRLAAR
jgi:hypothetical protein